MKLLIIFSLLCTPPLIAEEIPVLSFSPEFSIVEIDSKATIEIRIESVHSLKGYSLLISYDSGKIRILDVREGSIFPSPVFFASFVDSVNGHIKIESALLGRNRKVDGSGILFTVDVAGKNEGLDTLLLFDLNIRNIDLDPIYADTRKGILTITGPSSVDGRDELSLSYFLFQNFPNPFNPSTNIRFHLPHTSTVQLALYNASGLKVTSLVNGVVYHPGFHVIGVNGSGLASGVYYYSLEARSVTGYVFRDTGRMILLR